LSQFNNLAAKLRPSRTKGIKSLHLLYKTISSQAAAQPHWVRLSRAQTLPGAMLGIYTRWFNDWA
jgi:hypothetical protein